MDRELNIFQALELLGSLEAVTRKNLPPSPAPQPAASSAQSTLPPATSPENASPANSATAPAAVDPSRFETHREEYKPALRDQSVIEALLRFHHETKVARRPAAPVQKTPAETPAAGGFEPTQSFKPAQIHGLDAVPKPAPRFRRTPGAYHPILRPTPKPRNST